MKKPEGKNKSVRIVVRVEPELAHWLENRAEKADSSVGWLVRKALKKFQKEEAEQPSFKHPEFHLAGLVAV